MELNGVPVTDPAAAVGVIGYGHFSTMLVDRLRVKGLTWHLDRLVRDCDLVLGKALDPIRVRQLLRRVGAQCAGPTILRATVFDAVGPDDGGPGVLVTTRPPAAGPDAGLRVRTVNYVRDLPAVKHVGLFGPFHQRRLAQQAGFDDALFCSDGLVGEGPTWNLAVLIGDELIWPDHACLPGVTRRLVQHVLDQAGVEWSARPVERTELGSARTAFVTSSGIGVQPVGAIDGRELPGDPDLLRIMQSGYDDLTGDLL